MISHTIKLFLAHTCLSISLFAGALGATHAQAVGTSPAANANPAVQAPAPATTPAATSSATPGKAANAESVTDNPYGLKALWAQGDIVAKATLLILVLMSMGSWYVICTKLFEQSKAKAYAKAATKNFWSAGTVRQRIEKLNANSPFRFIAEKGLEGVSKHDDLHGSIDFNTWVSMGIQRAISNVQGRMQDGLALLATVGSTSPFIGLFGTVWGIYNALVKIGMSGQASIDKVAGPVGESLIMTAIGLAVAVPAVLGYNWLVRRNKAVMEDVNAFGSDLHAVLMSSQRK
jgi:biopolymer transport protein ExbB